MRTMDGAALGTLFRSMFQALIRSEFVDDVFVSPQYRKIKEKKRKSKSLRALLCAVKGGTMYGEWWR